MDKLGGMFLFVFQLQSSIDSVQVSNQARFCIMALWIIIFDEFFAFKVKGREKYFEEVVLNSITEIEP